jgi:predicted O-linked N-acetylglucosamine transferase (SPINDLY family)
MQSRFMRGRVGAAIYQAMEMTDCIAATREAYVSLALRLARDQDFRAAARAKIAAHRSKLFENRDTVAEWERFLSEASAA